MKISIGYKDISGPWGGGINFSKQFIKYFRENGIEVTNDLDSNDIDIILLTEPRRFTEASSFNHIDVFNYINKVNEETIVVNRINECDERKNTKGLNNFLINSSLVSDHTVFISSWLQELYLRQGFQKKRFSTIHNGADDKLFFPDEKNSLPEKFRIVTHHWGGNINKGFRAYKQLDELLNEKSFSMKFEFFYIGNLPENFAFHNVKVLAPMDQAEISKFLRTCHIYITGSENEPAGMHHIEGAMSGLPILYIDSGGITEYCENYGLNYELKNLREKLFELTDKYDLYKESLKKYKFTGKNMCKEYLNLLQNLVQNKRIILNERNIDMPRLKNQFKFGKKYFYL